MLCDIYSTFGTGLSVASTGVKGDAIDLGAAYNIGAGANKTPYVVITSDTAITGSGVIELYASASATSVASATKLMSIPVPAIAAEEIVFAGNIPAIPQAAAGQYLVLNVGTANTAGTVTAQIVDNPPVHHAYKGY